MRDTTTTRVLALADDLSGAAETAAALGAPDRPARIELVREDAPSTARSAQPIVVLDLDSRALPGATAEHVVRAALRRHADPASRVFLKIDSLLRGTVAATVRGAAEAPVVLAPALPANGRTVLGGVAHLHGVPLHQTDAWRAETARAPSTVASLLDPMPTEVVELAAVRSDGLAARLAASVHAGRIPVCDGETDADLDRVVAAAGTLPGVRLAGSGGLAAALGRSTTAPPTAPGSPYATDDPPRGRVGTTEAPDRDAVPHHLLVVVGTADPGAAEQVQRLTAHGVGHLPCDATALLAATADDAAHEGPATPGTVEVDAVLAALARGPAAVTVEAPDGIVPGRARELVDGLAATVARVVARADGPVDLVLTGGETARSVLDALAVADLVPVAHIHHGAVHSRTPDGTAVVTRPGSFGDTDSLVRIVEHLRASTVDGRLNT